MFDSARQAIRAAIELQRRFVDETVADPTLPLAVGIGLDAGRRSPSTTGTGAGRSTWLLDSAGSPRRPRSSPARRSRTSRGRSRASPTSIVDRSASGPRGPGPRGPAGPRRTTPPTTWRSGGRSARGRPPSHRRSRRDRREPVQGSPCVRGRRRGRLLRTRRAGRGARQAAGADEVPRGGRPEREREVLGRARRADPALRRGAIAGSEGWRIADMFPGARPLDGLEAALLRAAPIRRPA